jgi:hypothetical protein
MAEMTIDAGLEMMHTLIGDCIKMREIYQNVAVPHETRYSAIILEEANLDLTRDIIAKIFKMKMNP